MLVYQASKAEFMDDVDRDLIADHITAAFERTIHRANPREVESWRNSISTCTGCSTPRRSPAAAA